LSLELQNVSDQIGERSHLVSKDSRGGACKQLISYYPTDHNTSNSVIYDHGSSHDQSTQEQRLKFDQVLSENGTLRKERQQFFNQIKQLEESNHNQERMIHFLQQTQEDHLSNATSKLGATNMTLGPMLLSDTDKHFRARGDRMEEQNEETKRNPILRSFMASDKEPDATFKPQNQLQLQECATSSSANTMRGMSSSKQGAQSNKKVFTALSPTSTLSMQNIQNYRSPVPQNNGYKN